jgi:Fe-S cluster assembly ATP-binding protein
MSEARNTGSAVLSVRDLKVWVGDTEIVRGVSLDVRAGERHALMGPNGSGKSTLASALMGHPGYRVTGEILLDGHPIQDLPPHERARAGLFLGFQYPVAVPGVQVATFLRAAVNARRGREVPIREFRKLLNEGFAALDVPKGFASRYLNDGFSGGEKKRLEILQMLLLQPRFAVLDETDSGLDVDALKVVAEGIRLAANDETGVLLITHYQRILTYVEPTHVHVFVKGRLVRSGGPDLALYVEEHGYDGLSEAA